MVYGSYVSNAIDHEREEMKDKARRRQKPGGSWMLYNPKNGISTKFTLVDYDTIQWETHHPKHGRIRDSEDRQTGRQMWRELIAEGFMRVK